MLPELIQLLDCPICFNRLSMPVVLCRENGHAICSSCKLSVNQCPYCKSPWSTSRSVLLDQILRIILFRCKYCMEEVKQEDVVNHENKFCKKRIMTCFMDGPNGRCFQQFPRSDLLRHLNVVHVGNIRRITLNKSIPIPLKIMSNIKNFSVLYELEYGDCQCNFFLMRIHCNKKEKLFYVSIHLLDDGRGNVTHYYYEFSIYMQNHRIHYHTDRCKLISEIPEIPDKYPGGHPSGRYNVESSSLMFKDKPPQLFSFALLISKSPGGLQT